MLKTNTLLSNLMLGAIKTALDNNCQIHIFNGPVPNTPNEALDMVSAHTALVTISADGNGGGLQFDTVQNGVLSKSSAQAWSGTVLFEGAQASGSNLEPTFYRLCANGDNGRAQADSGGYRLQGTAGGPASGADLQFAAPHLTAGGMQPVGAFTVSFE